MLLIGLILLIVGLIVGSSLLFWIGLILLIVGLVLAASGGLGRPVGGRRHWW